jgi:acyl-CoA-binding protein
VDGVREYFLKNNFKGKASEINSLERNPKDKTLAKLFRSLLGT